MSKLPDELLGHGADNDGIEEYDNPLPKWWLGLFAICVVWGVGYAVDYHFISGRSQAASYEAEVAAAEARWPKQEIAADATVTVTADAITAGKAVYDANCVACHMADLTGGIGPNLVDDEWIHGGSPEEIRATIVKGVPEKGMLTWGPILGDAKINQVTAYIVDAHKKAK